MNAAAITADAREAATLRFVSALDEPPAPIRSAPGAPMPNDRFKRIAQQAAADAIQQAATAQAIAQPAATVAAAEQPAAAAQQRAR